MAYLHKGPGPSGGKIYNVEQSVGKGSVNAQGDVKLVQYMIRHIYGPQAAGLAVDGWIGPTTITWIERFQKDANAQGNNVLVDGRIDRALAQISSVSKTTYAVIVMNTKLRQVNPSAYSSLPNAVPLSAVPKPNPYNPAHKKVVKTTVEQKPSGKVTTYTYSDGTKMTIVVKGDGTYTQDPPPPPSAQTGGKLIFTEAPPLQLLQVYYYPKMNKTQYVYSDGSVAWYQGPPGGVYTEGDMILVQG